MKPKPEARQTQYERRRVDLLKQFVHEPFKSLCSKHDSNYTRGMIGLNLISLAESIYGSKWQIIKFMIRLWLAECIGSIKGRSWRFWHKTILRKSQDDIMELLVSEGHDPACPDCQGKGDYVYAGEIISCYCHKE